MYSHAISVNTWAGFYIFLVQPGFIFLVLDRASCWYIQFAHSTFGRDFFSNNFVKAHAHFFLFMVSRCTPYHG